MDSIHSTSLLPRTLLPILVPSTILLRGAGGSGAGFAHAVARLVWLQRETVQT
jgi:hypothetical protein